MMKEKFINLLAAITIPSSISLNISNIFEYKDLISFYISIIVSFLAVITSFYVIRNNLIKRKIYKIDLELKKMELDSKGKQAPKAEKSTNAGFIKNNVIR